VLISSSNAWKAARDSIQRPRHVPGTDGRSGTDRNGVFARGHGLVFLSAIKRRSREHVSRGATRFNFNVMLQPRCSSFSWDLNVSREYYSMMIEAYV
jgi:hypothetical protein